MRIAVCGAGASGIAAAISAARAGALVVLFEHTDSPGRKILITGNGKCNFTNHEINTSKYHSTDDHESFMSGFLSRWGCRECLDLFDSIGVVYRQKRDGYYPRSDTAESVRRALLNELARLKVEIRLNTDIRDIDPVKKRVNGENFDAVIIAMGSMVSGRAGSDGSGYGILRRMGLKVNKVYPALTPLTLKEDLSSITGVRCEAKLTLLDEEGCTVESSRGELQPFEKGFSGILAMDISGECCRILGSGRRAYVRADLYPDMDGEELLTFLKDRAERFGRQEPKDALVGMFPKKLINYLIHPLDTRVADYVEALALRIKGLEYELSDEMLKDVKRAQTAAGGLSLDEIDDDFALKKYKDIYVVGELVDIDGVCGGYNLHFAWGSGYMAGRRAAKKERER